MTGLAGSVIVLRGQGNRLSDLLRLVPILLDALRGVKPGEVRVVAG